MKNTLIKNVEIIDGTGCFPFIGDVLIENGIIRKIGLNIKENVFYEIEGKGLCLTPGFINTHSHSDLEVFHNPNLEHVIRQGITTEIIGQDGSSVAPVTDDIVEELADNMAPLAGVIDRPYWWRSYGEYLDQVNKTNTSVRIEGLIGHGTVRMCVMGNDNRPPNNHEMDEMKAIIEKSMIEGAKGMSLGLIYPPGSFADTTEIIELCKVISKFDGIVMVHMRNEQDGLLESLNEMEEVSRATGVRMHISHLKALGYRNWGKIKKALEKIEQLRNEGIDITFDQYPYSATCTGLKVIVPMWAYEGGEKAFQSRLQNIEESKRIVREISANIEARGGPSKILIAQVATEKNAWMAGKSLIEIANVLKQSPTDTAIYILREEGPSVVAIYFSISDEDVSLVMHSPYQGICSDGIMGEHPHPRLYGTFPRILSYYCRDLKLMTLQEAIRKMTSEPARRLRLWDRGMIREGMSADLVLFDFNALAENNSYIEPKKYPIGIKHVWVKGEMKF